MELINDYQKADFKHFDQMEGLCKDSGELLKGVHGYGFETPSPIQAKAIPAIADGRDLIAQSQSGTGKTGAFTIGMLTKINYLNAYPQGVIIANTRELASQIHYVLSQISKYAKINVSLCVGGKDVRINYQEAAKSHILVGTPGRIVDLIERDKTGFDSRNARQSNTQNNRVRLLDRLTIFILDEADVLLKDDFLEQIKKVIKCIPQKTQICIFSATYPDKTHEITDKFMNNPVHILVEREKVSLELIKHYKVDVQEERYKYDVLTEMYHKFNICQAVIFVNSIDRADTLAEKLSQDGHAVGVIHSKLTDIERSSILMGFRNMQTRVLVATDIISRGIDVQQVGLVINYDIPQEPDQYIHRVGRSGRFNKTGVAINFTTRSRYDKEKIRRIEESYTMEINDMPDLDYVNYYLTGSDGYSYSEKTLQNN